MLTSTRPERFAASQRSRRSAMSGTTRLDGRCRGPRGGLGADGLARRERQPPRRPGDPRRGGSGDGRARLPPAPRGAGAAHRPHPDHRARRLDARDGRQLPHAAGGGGCRGRARLRAHGRDARRRIRGRRGLRAPARSGRRRRDRAQRGDRLARDAARPGRPRARGGDASARRAVRRRRQSDHAGGARAATEHLLALGHRDRPPRRGPVGSFAAAERERGWREALGRRRGRCARDRPRRLDRGIRSRRRPARSPPTAA